MDSMDTGACGLFDCKTCDYRAEALCAGCDGGNRELAAKGMATCSVWECTQSKGLGSCLDCRSTVCRVCGYVAPTCPLAERFGEQRAERLVALIAERLAGAAAQPLQGLPATVAPDPAIARLRWYLAYLRRVETDGRRRTSSWEIGRAVQIKPSLVRKDLSYFGEFGSPTGYPVRELREQMEQILGLDETVNAAWVGARRLGRATDMFERFADAGLTIVAVFDSDPRLLGMYIEGLQVMDLATAAQVTANLGIAAAAIAVPDEQAQEAADRLAQAGIGAILNLTSTPLRAPPGVYVRNADLAVDLTLISYHCRVRRPDDGPDAW
jgi:redox-sensing transcriptional repressor